MKRKQYINLVMMFIMLAAACGFNSELPAAKVGGTKLMPEDIDLSLYEHLPDSTQSTALLNYVNDWVDQELLFQEAQREKFELTPALKKELDRVKKRMLVNLFIKDRIDQLISVSNQEILEYYEEHQNEFIVDSDHYRFLALKTGDQDLIRSISGNLSSGINIVDIYEQNPQRCDIVSLGQQALSDRYLAPDLAAALKQQANTKDFAQKTIQGATYFIRVLDYIERNNMKPLSMVQDEINQILILSQRKDKYEDRIGRLRANNEHEINMEILMNLHSNK
ncbi:hypothetical protein ACFL6L_03670 [candidate division KSB1 bacterium]